jgi:hypothetical protein
LSDQVSPVPRLLHEKGVKAPCSGQGTLRREMYTWRTPHRFLVDRRAMSRKPSMGLRDLCYSQHRWAIIDHVLVRGALPVAGDVFDLGVWSIADVVSRIEANFRNTGSDHFPIGGTIGF